MITKKLTVPQLEAFSVWDWRPIAADTFLSVLRVHSSHGQEVPSIDVKKIGTDEWAHHYKFPHEANDLIIVFAKGGRTTAFKRRSDPPPPPTDHSTY